MNHKGLLLDTKCNLEWLQKLVMIVVVVVQPKKLVKFWIENIRVRESNLLVIEFFYVLKY